jgi:holin-like protein
MLAQFALLMVFQFVGEAVVTSLGITFPGPLCGTILLLGYLLATGGPSKEMAAVATTLVDHLGLLFVPAGTAIVAYGALFASDGLYLRLWDGNMFDRQFARRAMTAPTRQRRSAGTNPYLMYRPPGRRIVVHAVRGDMHQRPS